MCFLKIAGIFRVLRETGRQGVQILVGGFTFGGGVYFERGKLRLIGSVAHRLSKAHGGIQHWPHSGHRIRHIGYHCRCWFVYIKRRPRRSRVSKNKSKTAVAPKAHRVLIRSRCTCYLMIRAT